ncbi:site-specific integrase [Nonomuraea angiospora]|uniref:site-specific integrase n=1 Tax=Nonomuraea angiospora TaxID=46172 RepID=UPI0033E488CF
MHVTASETYTAREAVDDWLSKGLKGRSEHTVTKLRILAETHVIPGLEKIKLQQLRADHVDEWLDQLADKLATTTLREIHSVLKRAIRQAEVSELHAYVVISLTTGVRTEEARALRWDHVVAWIPSLKIWHPVTEVGFKHRKFAIYVWRADREGGDPKTRRTLELPKLAAQALRQHHTRQAVLKLKAGEAWQDHQLVFCTSVGTPLNASNVRRAFRKITKRAGLGTTWSPRELRHSFVSIMSDQGVPIETIADLVGHAGTSVTEAVYRHQLRPVITKGAHTMNTIFGDSRHG